MSVLDDLFKLLKESSGSPYTDKKLTPLEARQCWIDVNDKEEKARFLAKAVFARISDPAALYEKILKEAPAEVSLSVKNGWIYALSSRLSDVVPSDHPNRKEILKLRWDNDSPEKADKTLEQLEKYAKSSLSAEEYASYRKITFLDGLGLDKLRNYPDYFSTLFEGLLTAEQKEEIRREEDSYVEYSQRDGQAETEPLCGKLIDGLRAQAVTKAEQDALDYIRDHVLIVNQSYGKYLDSRNAFTMNLLTAHDKEMEAEYCRSNPECEELITRNHRGPGYRFNPEKERDVFDYFHDQAEYELSAGTRRAMADIMHRLDDLDIIDTANVQAAEESFKCYGMLKVHLTTCELEKAMKEGRVKDLPRLVKNYRSAREQTDVLLDIAKKHFGSDPLLYGGNVDVARNAILPLEYRARSREVSQISSLLFCLKVCKSFGIRIDDFVKKPCHYLNLARESLMERYDIDRRAQGRSCGDKLYMMDFPPATNGSVKQDIGLAGLIMRAEEGFRCFEPDPEKTLRNTHLALFNLGVKFDNSNLQINDTPLSNDREGTIHNLILFDESKTVSEISADVNYKYDRRKNVESPMLDAGIALRSHKPDYAAYTEKIKGMVRDYQKNCLLAGHFATPETMNAIRSFPAMILEHRPNDRNLPEFRAMQNYVRTIRSTPTVKEILETVDDKTQEISEKAKFLTLTALGSKQEQYDHIFGLTRAVSYLPFVNNSATKLRREINESKRLMEERGITKDEIQDALDGGMQEELEDQTSPLDVEVPDLTKLDLRNEKIILEEQSFDRELESKTEEYSIGSLDDNEIRKQLLADPELDDELEL